MNDSESDPTFSDPFEYNAAFYDANINSGLITTVISIVQLLILLWMTWNEWRAVHTSGKARVCNSINMLIFFLIFSNWLSAIFQWLYLLSLDGGTWVLLEVCNSLSNFASACFQFWAIYYTWVRGQPVVEATARWISPTLRAVIPLFGLLQLASFILTCLALSPNEQVLDIAYMLIPDFTLVSNVLVLAFDVAILTHFILYRVRALNRNVERNMTIVSNYGIASVFCFQLFMGTTIAFQYIQVPFVPIVSVQVYAAVLNTSIYAPLLYTSMQIAMKWHLYLERERSRVESVMISAKTRASSYFQWKEKNNV